MAHPVLHEIVTVVDRARRLGLQVPATVRLTPCEAASIARMTGHDTAGVARINRVAVEFVDSLLIDIAGRFRW